MAKSAHFSKPAPIFNDLSLPQEAMVVGYAAIIRALGLSVPLPEKIALVSSHHRKHEQGGWAVYPKPYLPDDTIERSEIEALHKQLVFALKYEGIHLLAFKKLTQHYTLDQLNELVNIEPTGQYTRRVWFLIEWLSGERLSREDLTKKSYVKLVDESLQYAVEGLKSPRHLVINNLPGTLDFCPLVFKTAKLERYVQARLAEQQSTYFQGIQREVLQRAAAFLLLKDSRASFTIEGESPKSHRAARWGKAIGQAGMKPLSKEELLRLQQIIIENPRFLKLGYRTRGGFIGEHDRNTGEPIPDHISAKWQDVDRLMAGWLATIKILINCKIDAVVSAAAVSFGLVFIHPFEDGNGRLHRYVIHHILAQKRFSPPGVTFPISAAILRRLPEYRAILEAYSLPLLDFIEWRETAGHNVDVLNETIDYYRYFDATKQAEFLYDCVNEAILHIIPQEVEYLNCHDAFKKQIQDEYGMPDDMVALLVRFLSQNNGKLSKRAREKEFKDLAEGEAEAIEAVFEGIFGTFLSSPNSSPPLNPQA